MHKYAMIRRTCGALSGIARYELVDAFEDFDSANIAAEGVTGNKGDIIIVCEIEYVSDLVNKPLLMFVVGGDKHTHRLPPPFQVTGKNSPNWIHLWESANISPTGAFFLLFDVGVDLVRIRETVNECVLLAISKFDQKKELEHYAQIIKLGKENSDEEVQKCLDELDQAHSIATDYISGKIISSVINCIKSIDDFKHVYPALATAQSSSIVRDDIFVDIFKRSFPLREILLSLALKY